MDAVCIDNLSKRYGQVQAVKALSFRVQQGEVFGLLGPNGAGKTTTIRMIMDIIKPDSGSISVLGQPPSTYTLEQIGYMPEERGLYPDLKVVECLVYLAELKGVSRSDARVRALDLLRRVGLEQHARRPVKSLSRGMQQKVQFLATIMHKPELVILDEPFQGLDPVNAEMIKDMILELPQRGTAVIMSTHLMNQVEQMCDRILLMDYGQAKLYGPLQEIQARYGRHTLLIELENSSEEFPTDLPGVVHAERRGAQYEVLLREDASPSATLEQLVLRHHPITHFEVGYMPLDQIFISVVGRNAQETLQ